MISEKNRFMRHWRKAPVVFGAALLSLLVACTSADPSASATPQTTPSPGDPTAQPSTPGPTAGPTTPTATPVDSTGTTGTPTPTPAALPGGISSDIVTFALEDLTLTVGTTVTWINLDAAPHTSTAGAPGAQTDEWDTGTLSTGDGASHTFNDIGTFVYFCAIHPNMQATVTVIAEHAPAAPTATPTGPTATATPPPPATPTPAPTATPVPIPADALTSEIADFTLADLFVPLGTTVVWTNLDSAAHTTTAGSAGVRTGEWDSRFMAQNTSFMHTFDQAGTFAYFCTFHPSMTGTVTVIETPAPPGLATPGPQPTATPAPQPTATPAPQPTATPQPAAQASNIASFQLEDLTVSIGTTVTWTNQDGASHTATAGAPGNTTGQFDTGNLSQGMSGSHTFTQAGTFAYFCEIHPSMTATVTVES